MFFFYICFYTGYTLLPNNTINRYFLPLLPSTAPFFPDLNARGSRTKMTIDITDFRSRFLSLFGKSPPLVVPPWDPSRRTTSCARFVLTSSRREEKVPRDILPKITRTYVVSPSHPLSTPFLPLVLPMYVYLVAKNIREW